MVTLLFLLATANAACSVSELRSAACWALCRSEGADLGYYEIKTEACICGYRKSFKIETEPRIKLGTQVPHREE